VSISKKNFKNTVQSALRNKNWCGAVQCSLLGESNSEKTRIQPASNLCEWKASAIADTATVDCDAAGVDTSHAASAGGCGVWDGVCWHLAAWASQTFHRQNVWSTEQRYGAAYVPQNTSYYLRPAALAQDDLLHAHHVFALVRSIPPLTPPIIIIIIIIIINCVQLMTNSVIRQLLFKDLYWLCVFLFSNHQYFAVAVCQLLF